jgi:hypothetical protein
MKEGAQAAEASPRREEESPLSSRRHRHKKEAGAEGVSGVWL